MTPNSGTATTGDWLDRHWKAGMLLGWLLLCAILLVLRAADISALALADTDDNLRLAQIRAWLAGQNWYDLAQYRLAPPEGADIHWSRLPDLPIAALILLLRPLLGAAAENWAVAIAPLIPLGIGLVALALIVRRTIDPRAWPLVLLLAPCALALFSMWMPLRIDHHGWQLALLAVAIAGLVDPARRRGGVTSGVATALSFTIGLEMLIYLALIGAAHTVFWLRDRAHARRLAAYGASLGGASALGFAIFASNANRAPVCDALSPVWLSALVAAGAALVLLATLNPRDWSVRTALAAGAGAILALGFALLWPDCLSRPEGVSVELQALWLDNVREARPLYAHDWRAILALLAMPVAGAIGYALALRRKLGNTSFDNWLALSALALAGFFLLFWQMRLGPGVQLLFLPGAAMLAWHWLPRVRGSDSAGIRVAGTIGVLGVVTGIYAAIPLAAFPRADSEERAARAAVDAACVRADTMAQLSELPRGTVLAPIDLGPRLIVTTHHDAIAGPYHRNGEAIVDLFNAFREDSTAARIIAERRAVDYILLCPGMSGESLYGSEEPESLMARLLRGETPAWLEPIALPEASPYRIWRVR